MCGICGFVGKSEDGLLDSMMAALISRGPDEGGKTAGAGWGLGIRRLKVIDLETGTQPIHNEDKNIWIVFNGMVYNYETLREELIKKGHRFYTKTDTEVIVHLYEEEKENCVNKLRGMFAFALRDEKNKRLFLARDRLGKKPLYYYRNSEMFIFASDLNAILKYKKISKEIDPASLDAYLTFLYIPAGLCIFKGINKLSPASFLVFERNKFEVKKYWNLNCRPHIKGSEEDIAGLMDKKIEEAVRLRLRSDVPLGVFLSGGIDSSTIVAMMNRVMGGEKIKTFSIGYGKEASSYDELKYSRLVSNYFKTDHEEYILTPRLEELIRDVVAHFDEPIADSSAIPTYLVSKMARQKVTVALSGTGGDELFAGYPRYLAIRFAAHYEKLPLYLRKNMGKIFYNLIPESTASGDFGGRLKRFIKGSLQEAVPRYMEWISFFTSTDKQSLYTEDMKGLIGNSDPSKSYCEFLENIKCDDFLEKVFLLDQSTYLIDDLLCLADRMSMANSLELRSPFCDHELMELAAGIPPAMKVKRYRLKYIMKKMLRGTLPADVLSRKKQGFMVPLGIWFKKDLKGLAMDILSYQEIKRHNYFNPSYIKWMLDEHLSGRKNFTHKLWALIVFSLWKSQIEND